MTLVRLTDMFVQLLNRLWPYLERLDTFFLHSLHALNDIIGLHVVLESSIVNPYSSQTKADIISRLPRLAHSRLPSYLHSNVSQGGNTWFITPRYL